MTATVSTIPPGTCCADATADQSRGYETDKASYLRRMRRIEGQVRGIEKMIDDDKYCIDVLTQISATTSALQAVAMALLQDHLSHCVVRAAQAGGDEATEKIEEAAAAIKRLVRS